MLVMGAAPRLAHAEQRFALVISSNPGWSQDRPLRYADHDAERIRDVLVSLGGLPLDRVELLRDPDSADVRAALGRLGYTLRGFAEDTIVFVYYSGHADDRYLHLRGEPRLSHHELQELLRTLPSTVTIGVIDACKSGAVTQKGGAAAIPFDVDVTMPKLSGLVLLTSSGADELSQESRALAGSVFTHHLISGLRGTADVDGDERVTLGEAYHYAYELTRADTSTHGALQRPAFSYELSGQGDLVLTRLATAPHAQLRVPKGVPQKYVVLDAHEWRLIAEARPQPDRDVVVTLAPGRYRVKRVGDDRLEVASLELAPGARVDLDRVRYQSAPLSAGILKGDPSDLSPAEYHDWARTRAFGVLAGGNATTALNMFDQLVREAPDDVVAWRGRGRALIRMAESYRRVNDHDHELRALNEALRSDPSLTRDPEFQSWYVNLTTREQSMRDEAAQHAEALRADPRRPARYGLGIDFFSARGGFGIDGTVVTRGTVFSSVAFDFVIPGFDASVTIAPWRSPWSPYAGIGGHVSLKTLGVNGIGPGKDLEDGLDMFALHARLEAGAQWVHTSGAAITLGIGVLLYHSWDDKLIALPFPVLLFGQLF